jgi:hypothetical protein
LDLYVVTHQQSFIRVKNPNYEDGFDSSSVETTKKNYGFFFNAKTFLGFAYVLPMLELVQKLSEFTKGQHIFICDFVNVLCIFN